MLEIIIKLFLIAILSFCLGGMLYVITLGKLFKRFYHDVIGWHIPDHKKDHYLGINYCSVCKVCGKEIMQDSQGNWF